MDKILNTKLNNGVEIPTLGLGVFRTEGKETISAVQRALEVGYRHIDTAQAYNNEIEVGIGVRESGLAREDVFITTKISTDNICAGRTKQSFEESLTRLATDYVDLILIHWPSQGGIAAWKVLENLYAHGKARAIGVSNFQTEHLELLLQYAEIVPSVNQIEMHPHLTQEPLRKKLEELGIVGESWSPIGGIKGNSKDEHSILQIAQAHNKTAVQVILRWHLQNNMVVIPKSTNMQRILENSQIFDFMLSDEEMTIISGLNKDQRVGSSPEKLVLT